jgi:hypothetical protein
VLVSFSPMMALLTLETGSRKAIKPHQLRLPVRCRRCICPLCCLAVQPALNIWGWYETYSLNGPGWSLFFEYVANVLYDIVVRRFSNVALAGLVVLSAGALLHLDVTSPEDDVIGRWSLEPE